MDESFAAELGRRLARLSRRQEFSGAVLVRQGETDLFCRAYGYAHRGLRVRNRPETRFRIASVGKAFTAVAVLQLIDLGKLTLQARVLDILQLEGTTIPPEATVYHLLTMTSGIADWIDEESGNYEAEWAQFCREHPLYLFRRNADYLPIFSQQQPYSPLGEKHRYSNSSFILLGLMIEKVTGQSYFDYIRQHVFTPAGMTDTEFLDLDDAASNVAEGYMPVKGDGGHVTIWKKNYYAATAGPAADGGTTSTLEDLARFARALCQGKLLPVALAREMTSPQVIEGEDDEGGRQWRYGFGCFVLLDAAGQVIRWGLPGEEDGISCRLWHYPAHDVDVVILGNQSLCAGKAAQEVQALVLQR
jgi:CubicO group peptidase (beta-lactamase class C family)